ncbi:hypothetical protein BOO92_05835 [Vibrio navarrensis]|uniref:hypothetical protein n=1 Tax=Vibrio navarrensis TaxID=29495 RepID=UPI001865FEC5|nr:hypothetical protein [Vibrio navarrensis]MBE3656212.1 hypothetical protein [Vibrio navarrensis]MBE3669486.1 hypothetical protein [Vibrio navarrensis]
MITQPSFGWVVFSVQGYVLALGSILSKSDLKTVVMLGGTMQLHQHGMAELVDQLDVMLRK